MTASLRDVTDHALTLIPAERIDLVERLLESVENFVDVDIEDHWRAIAKRRLSEYERGEITGIPADVAHRQIRESLK